MVTKLGRAFENNTRENSETNLRLNVSTFLTFNTEDTVYFR